MLIRTEPTPNPDTLRFIPPDPLPVAGPREYGRGEAAPAAAEMLLEVEGVSSVLVAPGFVSVSRQSPAHDWDALKPELILRIGMSLADAADWGAAGDAPDTPLGLVERQIVDILRRQVSPHVARDGGDIQFVGFDAATGIVAVAMKGACGGCPSATLTLRSGVEAMLKRYVPEVRGVRTVAAQDAEAPRPFWKRLLGK